MNTTSSALLVAVLGVSSLGAGCAQDGDTTAEAQAGSCEAFCQRADECPNVTPTTDCIGDCEGYKDDGDVVGKGCPQAIEDGYACLTTASCEDLQLSAETGRTEECVYEAYQTRICDLVDSLDEPIVTACDATCGTLEGCPNLSVADGCRRACIEEHIATMEQSEACGAAALAVFECLPSLSCSELEARTNGGQHGCTEQDSVVRDACAP